jgi:hypothetical protein
MKKITSAVLGLLALSLNHSAQVTTTVSAPPPNGYYATVPAMPTGSNDCVYHRAAFLIPQSELTGFLLTNSVITTVALDYIQGVNIATTGQFSIYLQNTPNTTYSKGQTWSTILTGMGLPVYQGNLSLPVTAGSATVPCTLNGPTFTYNGGGIYVAFDWYAPTANATQPALHFVNVVGTSAGNMVYAFTGSGGPAPATLSVTQSFRPCLHLYAANTASNEVALTRFDTYGKMSNLFTAGHVPTAQIQNRSISAKSGIAVTLTISGANSYINTQTITSSVPGGGYATVQFAPFMPTNLGLNQMTVVIPPDQDNTNNGWLWSQTVTCNDYAFIPPLPVTTFTDIQYGLNPSGVYAYKFTPASNALLTGVNMIVSSNTTAAGQCNLTGVVVDPSGAILASTGTVVVNSTMYQTLQTFKFNTPFAMAANTPYYIGVAMSAGTACYPFCTVVPNFSVANFYRSNPVGSALALADRGYLAIGALITTPDMTVGLSQGTKTVTCKGETFTLGITPNGMNNFTWTASPITSLAPSTGTSLVVSITPTALTNATVSGVLTTFSVSSTATNGCKSSVAIIAHSISACNSIFSTENDGAEIVLMPNPTADGKTTITGLQSGDNSITVYNVVGQAVLNFSTKEDEVTIDMSQQPAGSYVVWVRDGNRARTIKLLHEK